MIIESSKIVVSGFNGFLGKNLLERFKDCDLLFIGRDHNTISEIEKFKPDFIFHFGGEIYENSLMIESNILFTYKMLEAVKSLNFKSFIYCGSSSEYGEKKMPMSENDILVPRNMYEATKGSGTLLCQAYANMYKLPISIVRPFSVYGRHEKKHRFIPTLFEKFEKKETATIFDGSHDFIFIDDFIDGVISIALLPEVKKIGKIINLGTGIQYSNFEVFEIFESIFGYSIDVIKKKTHLRPYDTNSWVANMNTAKVLINFEPKFSLIEGLTKIYNERYT